MKAVLLGLVLLVGCSQKVEVVPTALEEYLAAKELLNIEYDRKMELEQLSDDDPDKKDLLSRAEERVQRAKDQVNSSEQRFIKSNPKSSR